MNTHLVATFNDLEPAAHLRGRLQQAGIPAIIHDESKLERFGFMCQPRAAVHIEVSQPHYLEARRLIKEWDSSDGVLRNAVRCPECSSSRVEFPQLTRKFVTPAVLRVFMALHIIPEEFYCLDCQYTWPTVMPIEPPRDILNWPVDSHMGDPKAVRAPEARL
jgi:hypothetical protein